jgi:hypothetical protein
MDQTKNGLLPLTHDQIQGRNMWMVWTGGDDRLWDVLNWKSYGIFDLLKTISSNVKTKDGTTFGRHNRWEYLGLVNEPCFEEAKAPDPERSTFGLTNGFRDAIPVSGAMTRLPMKASTLA